MNIHWGWSLGFALFLLLGFADGLQAQAVPQYDLKVRLDPLNKQLTVQQEVTFVNPDQKSLEDIVFHIYPHRVYTPQEKNFMQRFAGYFAREPFPEGFQSAAMNIQSIKSQGQTLAFTMEGKDQTILRVKLSQPLQPQSSIRLQMDYVVQIPHMTIGRFGYHDGVYRLTRWYPILSVYQPQTGWDVTPFYPFHRPFYSEASAYRVWLTVPKDQVVAHSGIQTQEELHADGTKTLTYQSESPIREFTLAMSVQYQHYVESWEGIKLFSYYLPGHESQAKDALRYARQAFVFYTQRFGKYPYSEFRIVPVDLGYGGEQMSNLVFLDRRVYELPGLLTRYFDFLVSHETGHQWLYNLIGTNEFKEMWIEEGINSYLIEQYLAEQYGEDGEILDFPKWFDPFKPLFPKLTFKQTRDTRYKMMVRQGFDHSIVSELSSFSEPSGIFSVTYGKGARVLSMLRYVLGTDVLDQVLRRMYTDFAFKNITIADFKRLCEEESHKSLDGFFEQWFYQARTLDYAIVGVKQHELLLENQGRADQLPMDLEIVHQDGQVEHLTWDGRSQQATLPVQNSSPVVSVTLDPQKHFLDIDRTNNVWPRRVKVQLVPLYHGLYEIPTFLPDDQYTITAGPSLDRGMGLKASWQKPYDQIAYTTTNYEISEHLQHSSFGYELKNLLHSPTALGFEMNNTTDYQDGSDDLVSGKIFIRRELWPAQYNLLDVNDHISLYLLRNQSIHDRAALSGKEAIKQVDYHRSESIMGTALTLNRSGTAPDPTQGYTINIFAESSGHFLGATQYFNRGGLDTAYYIPATRRTTAALRLLYGGGYPVDKPLFYGGGINGLRGYELKSVRGANLLLGSLEYRFPLLENLKIYAFDHILGIEKIGAVVFGDVGEAWGSSIDSAPLRKDAGIGLRVTVNVGAVFQQIMVRFDVAQAIEDEHEDEPRFWFGVNHAF